ncbi:tetratricopeptide repeat protein, partial [Candidatus Gracilibacteria bacterium]|nr:tetratricopeptide repeat protein [Candidatus Gracilibacteria bacterium]
MEQQRALYLDQNDKVGAANVLNEIGVLRVEQQMYEKAMEMYEQCYAEFELMGHENAIAIKNNMADIKRLQGKYEEALALLAEIKPLAEQKNMTEIQGFIALTEGEVFEAQGEKEKAKMDYETAKAFFEEANSGAMLLAKEKLEGVGVVEPTPECFENATWKSGACACDDGYGISLNGQYCVKIPDNAHYVESPTDVWLCNAGFKEVGNQCVTTKELKGFYFRVIHEKGDIEKCRLFSSKLVTDPSRIPYH